MKKITNFIVKFRNIILVLFTILSVICLILSNKVNINSDISKYLPNDSETKIGKEIMDNEFEEQKSSYLNVMFKDLSDKEKEETLKKLSNIKGVSSVDYDSSENYNNGKYTLYTLNVDDYDHSKTSENIYNEIKDNYDYVGMNGTIYNEFKPVLKLWIIVVSISMAMIILTILSESYIEPWLYLISIGVAVFINKGTNIMFDSVSNITESICAILQLALSMDYSIMLSNRYRQEREKEKNKEKAMRNALYDSFSAISSSSITTVVGLLALVFMSFTIGKDLGFVLAKGVVLSLVSIFLFLPGLLLIFDKQIQNSKKKSLNINMKRIGDYSYKTRYIQLVLIILLFVGAFLLKGNLNIVYTGSQQDKVAEQFPTTNQIAIVYKNKYEDIINSYCKSIENDEKANQVLCYGNTLNEKLAYNELNQKLKDLNQDTQIDEYLIKIIYYNYYNKNNNDSMSLNEFITFIKNDVYKNDKISSQIDNDTKNNINKLEYFSTKNNVNIKRSIKDISNILGLNEKDLNDILILYKSKNLNTKITISDFINFVLNDISNDKNYSSKIDNNTLSSLNRLKPFTNKTIINKQMNQEEISKLFGIDKSLVEQLFMFYRLSNNSEIKMTINEFSTFALSLQNNESLKDMFDNEIIENLTLLKTLSDEDFINKKLNSNELSQTLTKLGINGIDSDTLNMIIFYYYYSNNDTQTKLSFNQFVTEIINDNFISNYLPDSIKNYKPILTTFSNKTFITTKLNREEMYNSLNKFGFDKNSIDMIYINIYMNTIPDSTLEEATSDTNIKLTPYEFLSLIKSNLNENNEQYNKVSLLLNIMNLSYDISTNTIPTYDYETMYNYLKTIVNDISETTILLGYKYYDYKNSDYNKMSIKELINFIISNLDNELISSNIGENKDMLLLASNIVNNTSNKYTYKEMSIIVSKDEQLINKIFNLASTQGLNITMSPSEFVNLILNNKDNDLLKNKINKDTINTLTLLNKLMDSTINNIKYNSSELSNILGGDKNTFSLLLSLYDSKYIKLNNKISLIDLTDFIMNNVINDNNYSNRISSDSKDKLITINGLMKNTLKGTKYNSIELYNVLKNLSDNMDYNMIDIVYIYHGSKNSYNDSWKLTVEEIINYTNDVLLKDDKYKDFLDDEMTDKITNAKDKINDSKKLLVTDEYSRMIINSKYSLEGKDTYKFINNAKETVGNNDGVYVIGDSPMALEMSKSFNSELDFITILTMVFIFVVVAFTFKDLLIPLILVLIIQCAVYVTMSILSITGTNVYFISILIVQAILMGATIDYAIVYTSYYKELRQTMNVKDAIINAYNNSIHTILTSSSILIIVTLVVSIFADAIAAKICETISQGTLCSAILILFVLPGVLSVFDKFICRKEIALNKTK